MAKHALRLDPQLSVVHETAFVASNATVIGDVHLGAEVSVWFTAVIRGDTAAIRVGARSNVQDGAILHADPGFPCTLGEGVTVGHRCVVHGATVGDNSLIGMGAIVMNGAVIGRDCVVGAGAVVTEGKQIPDGSLVLGVPAKVIKPAGASVKQSNQLSAAHYVASGQEYRERTELNQASSKT